ncbi:MAG: ArgE/DapE family deacylase [Bdellovibrio sp.]|nr:ArgE/DapE family deacylase [Bdellovibrio sp.]
MKNKLKNYFESNHERICEYTIRLLTEIVSKKTVNVPKDSLKEHPYLTIPGGESAVVAIVQRELELLGISYKIYESVKGRANIIATFGEEEPSLLVASHMDVVPAGDGWDSDPFSAFVKDGFIYGRGVLDNKGPLVSSLACLKALKECAIPLKGKFLVAAIANEEFKELGEDDPGLDYLLENKFLTPTYAIIPDIGGNMKRIDIAEKGRLQVKVTAIGKQAHGSTPERGLNAIALMSEFIVRQKKLKMKYKTHKYLKSPTLNIGTIRGGQASNIVAGQCDITLDIRYLPGQTANGIIKELRKLTKGIKGKFIFKVEGCSLSHEVNPDNILVKLIQSNAKNILGHTPKPFGMGGGTFAKGFNQAGIKAVGFGPGDDTAFHIANEYVEIKQLVQFAHMMTVIAVDLLKTSARPNHLISQERRISL